MVLDYDRDNNLAMLSSIVEVSAALGETWSTFWLKEIIVSIDNVITSFLRLIWTRNNLTSNDVIECEMLPPYQQEYK